MSFLSSIDISASGLTAQRLRLDVISQNIANVNTTRTEDGGPYRRKAVIFEEKKAQQPFSEVLSSSKQGQASGGVRVSRIEEDASPFVMNYDPGHPDANEEGYVAMPNVNIVSEMVNMISASRSYEANVTAMNAMKSMATKALEIGR
ncbi:MAG TPA: flagellar basal body rod protein FlgC [Epulopiscium sp.]|nr:flagellar basal body rod protein FlgC [Candidatus Epulonipiscium sp.]